MKQVIQDAQVLMEFAKSEGWNLEELKRAAVAIVASDLLKGSISDGSES